MTRIVTILGVVLWIVVWGGISGEARELTFAVPPEWTLSQPMSPEQKLHALLYDERGVVKAELIFAVEPLPPNLDLPGYLSALTQSLQRFFESYTPQETVPFSVGELSGLRHGFRFRVQGNPNDLQGLVFLFPFEGQVYTLSFDCLASAFPELESQFVRIAQGLRVGGDTPAVFVPSWETPPLGGEGTLSWVYQDAQHTFTIPLPQGARIAQELGNGAVYTAPNEGQIVILKLESEAAVQGIVAQVTQGKSLRGNAVLRTATGNPVQVALYASLNPETGVQYATLSGIFEGVHLFLLVVLPATEYEKAQGWIEALFTRAEVR